MGAAVKGILVGLVLFGVASTAAASGTKYVVKVRVDKRTDFARIKTYAWMAGWPAFDPSVDWQIEADVERELANLGLSKLPAEPSDVIVTYAAIRRTDVAVKSKALAESGLRPEYPAATIVVLLLEPHSRREVFRGRANMALERDPARLRMQIRSAIGQMFDKYPSGKD